MPPTPPDATTLRLEEPDRLRSGRDPSRTRPDLNLFAVLHAVIRHSNATRAAAELGVTPSAVSHALARLRRLLGDELFVATSAGLVPTARTLELAPLIADALARLAALVPSPFDPALSHRTFRVAMSEHIAVLLMPSLSCRIRQAAPGVKLHLTPSQRSDLVDLLDRGGLDLAIGWFGALPSRVHRTVALREHEAMIVREGHPLLQGDVTPGRLLEHDRVVVEFLGGDKELVGGFLVDRGVHRRVMIERLQMDGTETPRPEPGTAAVTVPHYAAVAPIVEATDLIGTLPGRLARWAARTHRVRVLDLPYEPLEVTNEMIHLARLQTDAGLAWLIDEIRAVIETIA